MRPVKAKNRELSCWGCDARTADLRPCCGACRVVEASELEPPLVLRLAARTVRPFFPLIAIAAKTAAVAVTASLIARALLR